MKPPADCTIAELEPYAREYLSRRALGNASRRPVLKACAGCGKLLNSRERRKPCPHCGSRNRGNKGK